MVGHKPSPIHAEHFGISYVWMGLIVPENTFLEVGPIGFYSDSDNIFETVKILGQQIALFNLC